MRETTSCEIMDSMANRLADGTLMVADACGAVFAFQVWRDRPNFQVVCPMCGNADGRGMRVDRIPSELFEVDAISHLGAYSPSDDERAAWSRIRQKLNDSPQALE